MKKNKFATAALSFMFFCMMLFPTYSLAGSPEKVVLQLKWKHQFQFAGYYAAIEKGYYAEEGIDVEIRELPQKSSVIDEVLSGNAQFGVGNAEILTSYINGAPLVVLAPIFQQSPVALVSRDSKNILSPHDLMGKTIEINPRNNGSIEILTMLSLEGLKPTEYKVVGTGLSLNKLLNNQIDATEIYLTNETYFLEKFGIPYNTILPKKYGVDFYAECLFTTKDYVRKNYQIVEAFIRATIKGWEYALNHPEEISQLIQSKYKTAKTLDHLLYEARKVKEFIQPNFVNIGHSNKGRWLQMMETLYQAGIINKTKPLDDFIFKPKKQPFAFIKNQLFYTLLGLLIIIVGITHYYLTHRKNQRVKANQDELNRQINELKRELNVLTNQLDLTLQKNKELEKFKESLLSNLSFEIRTPLNNIIGYSELLNDPKIKFAQAYQFSKEINKSCRTLQNQIDNLIDLSKLESNQFRLVYQRINLTELMGLFQIMLLNELKISDKEHIAIKTFLDHDEIDFDILSDRNLFKGIFQRLINNSVKYTSQGYIEIGLRKSDRENHLLFWIQDSGTGMSPDKAKHVFDSLKINNIQKDEGSIKMGLPIVKGIVDLMDGRIWLETAEGTGTTVNIEIPYTPIGNRKAKPELKSSPFYIQQDPPKLNGKTILVVEDIQSNYILLSRLLSETGCTIIHAKNGKEALDKHKQFQNIDLILMDLRLADMDGIEITRQIRKQDTQVIIIAQTAYSSGVKVNMSIEAGCNDFITKPISRIDLFNILRKYLLKDEFTA
jgi:ABC-type nitrate/sulfonate/bicarbonate transport system substrate-binding protein/CheY-like chemotaxis protein/two-component sensor histidine kinase